MGDFTNTYTPLISGDITYSFTQSLNSTSEPVTVTVTVTNN